MSSDYLLLLFKTLRLGGSDVWNRTAASDRKTWGKTRETLGGTRWNYYIPFINARIPVFYFSFKYFFKVFGTLREYFPANNQDFHRAASVLLCTYCLLCRSHTQKTSRLWPKKKRPNSCASNKKKRLKPSKNGLLKMAPAKRSARNHIRLCSDLFSRCCNKTNPKLPGWSVTSAAASGSGGRNGGARRERAAARGGDLRAGYAAARGRDGHAWGERGANLRQAADWESSWGQWFWLSLAEVCVECGSNCQESASRFADKKVPTDFARKAVIQPPKLQTAAVQKVETKLAPEYVPFLLQLAISFLTSIVTKISFRLAAKDALFSPF